MMRRMKTLWVGWKSTKKILNSTPSHTPNTTFPSFLSSSSASSSTSLSRLTRRALTRKFKFSIESKVCFQRVLLLWWTLTSRAIRKAVFQFQRLSTLHTSRWIQRSFRTKSQINWMSLFLTLCSAMLATPRWEHCLLNTPNFVPQCRSRFSRQELIRSPII